MKRDLAPFRVTMIGVRGFPGVQGGVEAHAENLCPRLAALGCTVVVIGRSTYLPTSNNEWRRVKFKRIWAPRSKGLEAIVHTFLGVLYAGLISRPDILHIQAIGPALMTPLARILGLRVVVTHHGPDYERQKWGLFGRLMLRLGERVGMLHSNARIAISKVIEDIISDSYKRQSFLIPNGVVLPQAPNSTGVLMKFGLDAKRYVIMVSRLVPEKRHLDLIEAFVKASVPGWKLAIVGAADHPDKYALEVLKRAKNALNVVITGFQVGQNLDELYANAGMFVLPSSHEGLPIALLEAMSFGLSVIASDIPANIEVGLPSENYFPLGNIEILAQRIYEFSTHAYSEDVFNTRRAWVRARFDWDQIAVQTLEVYKAVMRPAEKSVCQRFVELRNGGKHESDTESTIHKESTGSNLQN